MRMFSLQGSKVGGEKMTDEGHKNVFDLFSFLFFSSRISYILVYIARKDVILSVNRQCAALLFYNKPAL